MKKILCEDKLKYRKKSMKFTITFEKMKSNATLCRRVANKTKKIKKFLNRRINNS